MVIDGYPVILREKKKKDREGNKRSVQQTNNATVVSIPWENERWWNWLEFCTNPVITDDTEIQIIIEYFYHARFFG